MRQSAITGHHENRYPIAEALWVLAGIILLLAFADSLALLILALATVTLAAAWWIHRRVDHRVGSNGHAMTMVLPVLFAAAAALTAVLTLAAPAQAAAIDTRFDICAALRNGTSLASIETTLEARGYSASNAGALTGTTIRQQCPDQAAGVMAQISRQRG
jgi:predicted PurR-regulated permease PerM